MQKSVDDGSVKALKIYSKLIQGKADAAVLYFCCLLNVQVVDALLEKVMTTQKKQKYIMAGRLGPDLVYLL